MVEEEWAEAQEGYLLVQELSKVVCEHNGAGDITSNS